MYIVIQLHGMHKTLHYQSLHNHRTQSLGVLTVRRLHLLIEQLINNIPTTIISCGSTHCIRNVLGGTGLLLGDGHAVVVIGDRCTRAAIGLIEMHEVSRGGGLIGGSGAAIGLIEGHPYPNIMELWFCEMGW